MTVFFLIDSVSSSFEKKELDNLINAFDKVVLISSDKAITLPSNEKLTIEIIDYNHYKTKSYILKAFKYTPLFISELFSNKLNFSHFNLFTISISTFLRNIFLSEKIHAIVNKHNIDKKEILLYSFWFNHWGNAISLLKPKIQKSTCISRAHGTDLYEERVVGLKKIAFRNFYLKKLDYVFSVSKKGADYMQNKYPNYKTKIKVSYLGTDGTKINTIDKKSDFTIVSCAKIRAVKRLHLIPEILSYTTSNINWVHIGGEAKNDPYVNQFNDSVNKLKLSNQNVKVDFLGDLNNNDVLNYYSNNPIDLFISVSENEGLPVSMMEAISAGIPILSTDVGGCNEIVNESTGVLIPKDFSPEEAAKILSSQNFKDKFHAAEIHNFWLQNFNNKNNFANFLTQLNYFKN